MWPSVWPTGRLLFFKALADLEILVPGVGYGKAKLLEHVLAVDDGIGDVEQRHAPGDAIHRGGAARPVVDLVTAQLLEERVVVGQAAGEQMRLVGVHLDHVGAAAALDRGGDPRRHVVLVDLLDRHLDAGGLRELLGLPVDLGVGGGNEAGPLQIVHLARLRVGRRLAAKERCCHQRPAGDGGRLDELPPSHGAAGWCPWRGVSLLHLLPPI